MHAPPSAGFFDFKICAAAWKADTQRVVRSWCGCQAVWFASKGFNSPPVWPSRIRDRPAHLHPSPANRRGFFFCASLQRVAIASEGSSGAAKPYPKIIAPTVPYLSRGRGGAAKNPRRNRDTRNLQRVPRRPGPPTRERRNHGARIYGQDAISANPARSHRIGIGHGFAADRLCVVEAGLMRLTKGQITTAALWGCEDGRMKGRDAPDRYDLRDPRWRPWNLAMLTAVDSPIMSRHQIARYVLNKTGKKR